MMQRFDCLRSPHRDVVWLVNVTLYSTTLKCGLAYIQGNIPTEQQLVDINGNQICSLSVPLEYASSAAFSLLSSLDDDILFQLAISPPQ
jgi:hypothetical protein